MAKTLLVMFLCSILSACSPEQNKKQLGGGYFLVAVDAHNHMIVHEDTVVVLPDVSDCTTHDKYAVCLRREPAVLNDRRFFDAPFGWLVLDTRSGKLVQGLDQIALKSLMRTKNISLD